MYTYLDSCLIKEEWCSALVEFTMEFIINLFEPWTNIWHDWLNSQYSAKTHSEDEIGWGWNIDKFLREFLLFRLSCSVDDSLSSTHVIFFFLLIIPQSFTTQYYLFRHLQHIHTPTIITKAKITKEWNTIKMDYYLSLSLAGTNEKSTHRFV